MISERIFLRPRLFFLHRPHSSKSPTALKSFFALFPNSIPAGPPPVGQFSIDTRALQREFFALQQKFHPDLAPHLRSSDGPSSAYINRAYATLKEPLLRAQYLLSLRNINVGEDETIKINDEGLLIEVLNAHEQIHAAQTEQDLIRLKTANDSRIDQCLKVLGTAFNSDDLERAKDESVKLRYWVNIKNAIDNWEKGQPVVLIH